jgi:hypothetical protein
LFLVWTSNSMSCISFCFCDSFLICWTMSSLLLSSTASFYWWSLSSSILRYSDCLMVSIFWRNSFSSFCLSRSNCFCCSNLRASCLYSSAFFASSWAQSKHSYVTWSSSSILVYCSQTRLFKSSVRFLVSNSAYMCSGSASGLFLVISSRTFCFIMAYKGYLNRKSLPVPIQILSRWFKIIEYSY